MAIKTIATNRKAYHNYHVLDSLEAGMVLTGTEIKSIRAGRVSLSDAYVRPEGGELWLLNAHIARYEAGSYQSHTPTRPRKGVPLDQGVCHRPRLWGADAGF